MTLFNVDIEIDGQSIISTVNGDTKIIVERGGVSNVLPKAKDIIGKSSYAVASLLGGQMGYTITISYIYSLNFSDSHNSYNIALF